MKKLIYTPYELALIVTFYRMNTIKMTEFLNNIFKYDNAFIEIKYRHD
ncbi:MAG: hypothetical protein K2H89_08860 [Oscillospiraceae bacterium]|nr:hypothetical protein [Oscillospiraceae bacterium]